MTDPGTRMVAAVTLTAIVGIVYVLSHLALALWFGWL